MLLHTIPFMYMLYVTLATRLTLVTSDRFFGATPQFKTAEAKRPLPKLWQRIQIQIAAAASEPFSIRLSVAVYHANERVTISRGVALPL